MTDDSSALAPPPDDDIADNRLLGARGMFLGDEDSRKEFWGYAKQANGLGDPISRKDFSSKIRDCFRQNYLSKAEANYCAGWAALAVQIVAGKADEDGELVALLCAARPGNDDARITGA